MSFSLYYSLVSIVVFTVFNHDIVVAFLLDILTGWLFSVIMLVT